MPRSGDSRVAGCAVRLADCCRRNGKSRWMTTEANVDALGEQLRRLHREQGGLQLPM